MSRAREPILALVSGLPSGLREAREFMALQAFVDDSGSEPQSPVMVLAGHISSTARWLSFADEWREALLKPPGLAYFKASEAMGRGGEFSARKGWDDDARNARVIELADIVQRFATASISVQLMRSDWQETNLRSPGACFQRAKHEAFHAPLHVHVVHLTQRALASSNETCACQSWPLRFHLRQPDWV